MSKSSTTTARNGLLRNPHPGEILLEEFLKPMDLSQNALARAVRVAPRRINEIVLGKRILPRIPIFALRAISVSPKDSFSGSRWITI